MTPKKISIMKYTFEFRRVACVSDPKAARDIVFGPDGILKYINEKKSYVDMSTVDATTTIGKIFFFIIL